MLCQRDHDIKAALATLIKASAGQSNQRTRVQELALSGQPLEEALAGRMVQDLPTDMVVAEITFNITRDAATRDVLQLIGLRMRETAVFVVHGCMFFGDHESP